MEEKEEESYRLSDEDNSEEDSDIESQLRGLHPLDIRNFLIPKDEREEDGKQLFQVKLKAGELDKFK